MGRPLFIHCGIAAQLIRVDPCNMVGVGSCESVKKELMALFGPYSVLFWHFL